MAHRLGARHRHRYGDGRHQPGGDRADATSGGEGGEGGPSGVGVGHDEGPQSIAQGGGHGCLPSGVDLDETAQHAKRMPRGRGRHGLERERQGVDAGEQGPLLGLGLAAGRLGRGGGRLGRRLPYLRLVDGGHESPLGGLRFPELVLDALAGSGQTVAALLEGVEPGDESGHLGLAEVDTGPQGAELATDLSRLPARAGDARGQSRFEVVALPRQLGFGRGETVGLGNELACRRVDLGQLAGDARRLGLEGRDQGVIDER